MTTLEAIATDLGWRPGIGDPTLMGWLTVLAYFGSALACARAARADRRDRVGPAFWWTFAAGLACLGFNKQLDLQTALTGIGRALAKEQGWYERRRGVQLAFVAAVGVAALAGLVGSGWLIRRSWRRRLAPLVGGVLLAAFVLIRASSFHHVDRFLGLGLAGLRWNWNAILELGGILVIGASAIREAARGPLDRVRSEDVVSSRYPAP